MSWKEECAAYKRSMRRLLIIQMVGTAMLGVSIGVLILVIRSL